MNSFYFHNTRGRMIGQYKKQVKRGNHGARREGRTPTLLREPDFESGASAIPPLRHGGIINNQAWFRIQEEVGKGLMISSKI